MNNKYTEFNRSKKKRSWENINLLLYNGFPLSDYNRKTSSIKEILKRTKNKVFVIVLCRC